MTSPGQFFNQVGHKASAETHLFKGNEFIGLMGLGNGARAANDGGQPSLLKLSGFLGEADRTLGIVPS